ncbi:hypothetical protein [Nocardioides sp.]|uniref:hypothetical protein n=1 Tax=Nocardioides sp. TaxID=35761 RepID=UPI0039E7292B
MTDAPDFPRPMTDDEIRLLVARIAAKERTIGIRAVRRQANAIRAEYGMPTVEAESLRRSMEALALAGRRIRAALDAFGEAWNREA